MSDPSPEATIEQLRDELAKAQAASMQLHNSFLEAMKSGETTYRLLSATAAVYEALLKVQEASSPLLQFGGADPLCIDAFNQAKEQFEGSQRALHKVTGEVASLLKANPR